MRLSHPVRKTVNVANQLLNAIERDLVDSKAAAKQNNDVMRELEICNEALSAKLEVSNREISALKNRNAELENYIRELVDYNKAQLEEQQLSFQSELERSLQAVKQRENAMAIESRKIWDIELLYSECKKNLAESESSRDEMKSTISRLLEERNAMVARVTDSERFCNTIAFAHDEIKHRCDFLHSQVMEKPMAPPPSITSITSKSPPDLTTAPAMYSSSSSHYQSLPKEQQEGEYYNRGGGDRDKDRVSLFELAQPDIATSRNGEIPWDTYYQAQAQAPAPAVVSPPSIGIAGTAGRREGAPIPVPAPAPVPFIPGHTNTHRGSLRSVEYSAEDMPIMSLPLYGRPKRAEKHAAEVSSSSHHIFPQQNLITSVGGGQGGTSAASSATHRRPPPPPPPPP